MRAFATAVVVLLAGCTLSTVPGPIWSARGNGDPTPLCIYPGEFVSAGDPALGQRAREALLARARTMRAQCEVQQFRVDVRGIQVGVATDAYGPAADLQKESAPQPARMRVTLTATLHWVPCGGLTGLSRQITVDEWMPYSGDPWLAEERAASRLEPLASRWWDQAALRMERHTCRDEAVMEPSDE